MVMTAGGLGIGSFPGRIVVFLREVILREAWASLSPAKPKTETTDINRMRFPGN